MVALLLIAILLPTSERLLPSRYSVPLVTIQPIMPHRLKAATKCRCFVAGKEVTYDEFMKVRRTVTRIEQENGEVILLEADE